MVNGSSFDVFAASFARETEAMETEPPPGLTSEYVESRQEECREAIPVPVDPHNDDFEDHVGEAGLL